MKKTNDYDNVFKTLKTKHKRLFISVINETFHRDYPPDIEVMENYSVSPKRCLHSVSVGAEHAPPAHCTRAGRKKMIQV